MIQALWDCKFNPKMITNVLNTLNQTRDKQSNKMSLFKEGATFLTKMAIKKLTGYKLTQSKDASHPNFHRMDHFSQQLYVIFYETILPTLLRNYDRYSMINGVEIRMPFMDHRLVEFVFSLPFSYKFDNGYTKWLIRKSVDSFMPSNVTWRKSKIGFNSPIIQWLQRDKKHNGIKEWALDLVHSQDFLQCSLVKNAKQTQQEIIDICSGKVNSFSIGEKVWCELNPYIWEKSLKKAVRF